MAKSTPLWRTTIHIWTEYDPQQMELQDLAREATDGDGYCDLQRAEYIRDPNMLPHTEFFDDVDDSEKE